MNFQISKTVKYLFALVGVFLTNMAFLPDNSEDKIGDDLECVKIVDSGKIKTIILYNECDKCMKAEIAWYGKKNKTIFDSFKIKADSREKVKLKSSSYELVNEFECK